MRAHGYTGDLENVDEKVTFLEEKFKAAGIPKPRNIRDWYTKHTRPNSNRRVAQIQLCFAFELSLEEARDFFRRVCLERDFDCHDMDELVYYFALKNRISYPDARKIIERLPEEENIDCLLEANRKAIHFASLSSDHKGISLEARVLADRANFLIRILKQLMPFWCRERKWNWTLETLKDP